MRITGVLRGMGREVSCEVVAWKESSSTGRVYTRCRIGDEAPDLPDGSYALCIGGYQVMTRKWEGRWLLRYLPNEIRLEEVA